jgi:RNA polymerase sigma factor (sigma-70 family)
MRSSVISRVVRVSGDIRLLWDQLPWLRSKAALWAPVGLDVDDLVQQTLVQAWRYWHLRDPSRPLRPWLTTIMRQRIWKWNDKHQRHTPWQLVSLDQPVGDEPGGGPVGAFIPAHRPASDTGAYDILRALPPEQADLLEGLYMGGYTTDELASMHGVPRGTIASRAWTARQAILNPPRESNLCAFCDEPVAGHPNKRYCSDGCRQKAKYRRHRRPSVFASAGGPRGVEES